MIQNLQTQWESFFGIIIVLLFWYYSMWVTHLTGMGFYLIVIVPLLYSCCIYFFVFEWQVSFYGGFQSPVDSCSTVSCDFGSLKGGDEHMSFYSTILNQKPVCCFDWMISISLSYT